MKRAFLSGVLCIVALVFLVAQGTSPKFFPDIILTLKDGSWLDTRVYATLSDAIAGIGSTTCTVHIVREETLDNDKTIPATAELRFLGSGKITQTAGTLTINSSQVVAPERTVFSATGAGSYDFRDGMGVRSSWFDDFDDAVAITSDDTVSLIVDGWESVSTTQALGSDVALKFEEVGDFLEIDSGIVLSNVSEVLAGSRVIMLGAGRVDFADSAELRSSWFERFDEAVRYIDDSEVSLVVDEPATLVANTTMSENTQLIWNSSSDVITVSADLSVGSQIRAGAFQIFSDSGGDVTFSAPVDVLPEWWGAAGDGVTDDEGPINNAFNSIEGNGGRVIFDYKTYAISTEVNVQGSGIIVEGNHATLEQTTQDSHNLYFEGTYSSHLSNNVVRNLNINGDATALGSTTGTGIAMLYCDDSLIENCDVKDTGSTSITVSGLKVDGDPPHGYRNTVSNNYVYDNQRGFGIHISGQVDAFAVGNRVDGQSNVNANDCMQCKNCLNFVFDGNEVRNCNEAGINIRQSGQNVDCIGGVISNNWISDTTEQGVYIHSDDADGGTGDIFTIAVSGNSIYSPGWSGISLLGEDDADEQYTDYCSMTGNTINDADSHGITLRHTRYSIFSGNSIIDPQNVGVIMTGCQYNTFTGNAIYDSGDPVTGDDETFLLQDSTTAAVASTYNSFVGNTIRGGPDTLFAFAENLGDGSDYNHYESNYIHGLDNDERYKITGANSRVIHMDYDYDTTDTTVCAVADTLEALKTYTFNGYEMGPNGKLVIEANGYITDAAAGNKALAFDLGGSAAAMTKYENDNSDWQVRISMEFNNAVNDEEISWCVFQGDDDDPAAEVNCGIRDLAENMGAVRTFTLQGKCSDNTDSITIQNWSVHRYR
jgi:hypothetical protein